MTNFWISMHSFDKIEFCASLPGKEIVTLFKISFESSKKFEFEQKNVSTFVKIQGELSLFCSLKLSSKVVREFFNHTGLFLSSLAFDFFYHRLVSSFPL